jgi:hypothetical protein
METKKKILLILVLAFGLIVCLPKVGQAAPMGTAWTYQGRLMDANKPADGLYDFQFKLYDANSDGHQIGGDVNNPDVDVIDGSFVVELDFGNVFDGNDRWLLIGVRPGSQNDPNVYTALSPRQEITPTPYALYAKTAGSGGSLWQVNGTSIYYNNGNIGIGTSSPEEKLTIRRGTIKASSTLSAGKGVYGEAAAPDGTGVYGEAINNQVATNYGGYFTAAGATGRGVYGAATYNGSETNPNYGGYFTAAGFNGQGVYGESTGTKGRGVYGRATGADGSTGVYGLADGTQNNYGGYFKSAGNYGRGVYGYATGHFATGVYGQVDIGSGYAGYFLGGRNYFQGNVGIGTENPTAKLEVAGQVKITGGSPATGRVLTSDAAGLATWQTPTTPPYGGWIVAGNDVYSGVLGNVGIGTSAPDAKLTVADGTIKAVTSVENGRAIWGWASRDIGANQNFGGFFEAAGTLGAGVCGQATGSDGKGVFGLASNSGDCANYGGYFWASGSGGTGVYSRATGNQGTAVYGYASNTDDYANYGGSFQANGAYGKGVRGLALNGADYSINWGGEFIAAGAYGTGVRGEASNSGDNVNYGGFFTAAGARGYAGYFKAEGTNGIGIYAQGGPSGYSADLRGKVRIRSLGTGNTVMELGEGLDYAEGFNVSSEEKVGPGAVLVIDRENPGKLTVSRNGYDKKVAGIVAGAKGLTSGVRLGVEGFDCDVALAGRVYCNVDAAEYGIEPGDMLTTSDKPGYAMKAADHTRASGAILGKAMEKLEKGNKGQILVLVTLQ